MNGKISVLGFRPRKPHLLFAAPHRPMLSAERILSTRMARKRPFDAAGPADPTLSPAFSLGASSLPDDLKLLIISWSAAPPPGGPGAPPFPWADRAALEKRRVSRAFKAAVEARLGATGAVLRLGYNPRAEELALRRLLLRGWVRGLAFRDYARPGTVALVATAGSALLGAGRRADVLLDAGDGAAPSEISAPLWQALSGGWVRALLANDRGAAGSFEAHGRFAAPNLSAEAPFGALDLELYIPPMPGIEVARLPLSLLGMASNAADAFGTARNLAFVGGDGTLFPPADIDLVANFPRGGGLHATGPIDHACETFCVEVGPPSEMHYLPLFRVPQGARRVWIEWKGPTAAFPDPLDLITEVGEPAARFARIESFAIVGRKAVGLDDLVEALAGSALRSLTVAPSSDTEARSLAEGLGGLARLEHLDLEAGAGGDPTRRWPGPGAILEVLRAAPPSLRQARVPVPPGDGALALGFVAGVAAWAAGRCPALEVAAVGDLLHVGPDGVPRVGPGGFRAATCPFGA